MSRLVVVTELVGGLGNQLFQYGAGKALAKHYDAELNLCTRPFERYDLRKYELNRYRVEEKFASNSLLAKFGVLSKFESGSLLTKFTRRFFLNKPSKGYFVKAEEGPAFDAKFFDASPKNVYLSGYWQSFRYLDAVKEELRAELVLPLPNEANQNILRILRNEFVVSLHVRRGDYVSNSNTNQFHGTCSPLYYERAIETFLGAHKVDRFLVFSDDLRWCRDNLNVPSGTIFCDNNSPADGHEDIRLMQNCSGHIIANSSFSWWGAWLAKDTSLVIAPQNWVHNPAHDFADLLPKHWVRISGLK